MSELVQWKGAKYWTKSWNPVIGCRACSPACENCWAREWARRFGVSFEPHEPKAWAPPSSGVVFCGNLTDLFGEWCDGMNFSRPEAFVGWTLGRPKATYLWLTKRAKRMADALRDGVVANGQDTAWLDECEMGNQYFGFTAEDQERYVSRCNVFVTRMPDWVRWWVSAEPLLGPIDLCLKTLHPKYRPKCVVVGCESGRGRRPCRVEWVENIVWQCMEAGVPVFVKQLDLGGRCVTDIEKFPEHLRVRQVPWAAAGTEVCARRNGRGQDR